eukprot:153030_1
MDIDAQRIMRRLNKSNDVDTKEHSVKKGWKRWTIKSGKPKHMAFIPNYSLEDVRTFSTSPYLYEMCKAYASHSNGIRFQCHSKNEHCVRTIKTLGILSKVKRNDRKKQTDYPVYIRFGPSLLHDDTITYCRCPNGLKTSGACVHSITALYALYYKLRGESILLKQHGVDGLDDIQWDGYESDSDTDRDSDGCECVSDSNSDNDLDGYQSDSDSNSDSDSDGYESDSNTESGSGSDSDSNCDADIDLENPLNTANDEVIVEAAVAIETSTSSVKVC